MKIRNRRPGALVIADANLTLARGEVAEVKEVTRQIESALVRGLIEEVPEETPIGAPGMPEPPIGLPADYERLSIADAIEYIDEESNPMKLRAILHVEARETVAGALKRRLEEIETSGTE